MAFLGVAPDATKAEIRAKSAMLMVMPAASFTGALVPTSQTDKDVEVPAAGTIYMLGVAEHKTIKTPVTEGDSVVDQLKNTVGLFKNLEGTATLLGEIENDVFDGLEDETWTMFIADPATVTSMSGYSSANTTLSLTTGQSFTAHEILHNISINGGQNNDYGDAIRNTITFKKELESHSDGRYKDVVVTVGA